MALNPGYSFAEGVILKRKSNKRASAVVLFILPREILLILLEGALLVVGI